MTQGNGSDKATLDYSLRFSPPIDPAAAERNLKEAKRIFERMGVIFMLNSGTCIAAVRDNAFIPWDDDVDLISVLGINGLTEETRWQVASAFTESGFYVGENTVREYKSMSMMKDFVRVDWSCAIPVDDHVHGFPGIRLPAGMFTSPREGDFLGEKFMVPNPPEEYLRLKYGEEWMTPKRPGEYEQDVVAGIRDEDPAGRPSRIRVLDERGRAVPDAEVRLVGIGRFTSGHDGIAQVVVPDAGWYALVVRYPGHEQVLYMEELRQSLLPPDRRADPASAYDRSGRVPHQTGVGAAADGTSMPSAASAPAPRGSGRTRAERATAGTTQNVRH